MWKRYNPSALTSLDPLIFSCNPWAVLENHFLNAFDRVEPLSRLNQSSFTMYSIPLRMWSWNTILFLDELKHGSFGGHLMTQRYKIWPKHIWWCWWIANLKSVRIFCWWQNAGDGMGMMTTSLRFCHQHLNFLTNTTRLQHRCSQL